MLVYSICQKKKIIKAGQEDSEEQVTPQTLNTDKLISYIERYNLGQYDALVMGKEYTQLKDKIQE
jgi:hypothetical protein